MGGDGEVVGGEGFGFEEDFVAGGGGFVEGGEQEVDVGGEGAHDGDFGGEGADDGGGEFGGFVVDVQEGGEWGVGVFSEVAFDGFR